MPVKKRWMVVAWNQNQLRPLRVCRSCIACLLISSKWLGAFLCPPLSSPHTRPPLWTRVPLSRRIKTNQIREISFIVIYIEIPVFSVWQTRPQFWKEVEEYCVCFSLLFTGKKKNLIRKCSRSWPFSSYIYRSRFVWLYLLEKWLYSLIKILRR